MGLLQGARQNPGAPEDEEWGLRSPLAGLWFGRFAVLPLRSCAPRASPVWVEALGAPQSFLADAWLGLEIAWPPQGCVPRGAGSQWEDLSVRVGLRRP